MRVKYLLSSLKLKDFKNKTEVKKADKWHFQWILLSSLKKNLSFVDIYWTIEPLCWCFKVICLTFNVLPTGEQHYYMYNIQRQLFCLRPCYVWLFIHSGVVFYKRLFIELFWCLSQLVMWTMIKWWSRLYDSPSDNLWISILERFRLQIIYF